MFELSVAWKYLLPKRRQLSVSIISLISIIVIALVVWLILVFFSVTRGLEKGWVEKLVTLTAPIRLTPTEHYYNSYYHQIDHYSSVSGYRSRSIDEKKDALKTDPYNSDEDGELPADFPSNENKDLVKLGLEAIQAIPGITPSIYEATHANLRLRLSREQGELFLNQAVYLGTFDDSLKKITFMGQMGEGDYDVLAPKSFKDGGVRIGDKGYVTYYAPTASSLQEQRLPVEITGFYDPGIVPLGGKFLLAKPLLVRTIRSAQGQDNVPMTNGINVRFEDLGQADAIKKKLMDELEKRGIAKYWKVESYSDFDYAKDLLHQLKSEKNIFSLISAVIIIVACSNIISMLIILVNDKKREIGILRSMGATSGSIALIFGLAGFVMGLVGTLMGTALAFVTLKNLKILLDFISHLQGFDAFNPIFYGEHLPTHMSYETLLFVLSATGLISLLAGLIPALKSSRMKPAAILRSE